MWDEHDVDYIILMNIKKLNIFSSDEINLTNIFFLLKINRFRPVEHFRTIYQFTFFKLKKKCKKIQKKSRKKYSSLFLRSLVFLGVPVTAI